MEEWQLFTSLRDESNGRHALFINGNLEAEGFWDDTPSTSPENLIMGKIVTDQPYYYNGLIDDIRIYNRPLSDQEIVGLYNIPEPSTLILLTFGFLGTIGILRLKKNKK